MSAGEVYRAFAGLSSEHIRVEQDRCVMVRNRNAACARCSDVCVSGCISMVDGLLVVEREKCIGCGTCATVCPTGALEARLPGDPALLSSCLKAAGETGSLVIACRSLADAAYGTYDPAKVVEVTCLGRVDESLLAALVEKGVEDVSLCCRPCQDCEHVEGRHVAEQVCSTACDLLEAWGHPVLIQIVEGLPERVAAAPSQAFAQPSEPVEEAGEPQAESETPSDEAEAQAEPYRPMHVMADGTLPHFIPDRRERLLDSLASIGEPAERPLNVRLWGHVVVDTEKCTSCRACAVFCPTGAIRKFGEVDDEVFGIEHYPGDCVKCLCCENVCRPGALQVLDEVDASWIMEGRVERVEMPKVRVRKGCSTAILNSIRAVSGMEEIYER